MEEETVVTDLAADCKVSRATLGDDIERINTRLDFYLERLAQAKRNVNNLTVLADRRKAQAFVDVYKTTDPKGRYGVDKINVDIAKGLVDTDLEYLGITDNLRKATNEQIDLQSAVQALYAAKDNVVELSALWRANYFGNKSPNMQVLEAQAVCRG